MPASATRPGSSFAPSVRPLRRTSLGGFFLAALVAAACGGGGGDGGTGPPDTNPPPMPVGSLIEVTIPQAGTSLVRGSADAVEAGARVRVTNVDASVTQSTNATSEGSFNVSIAATLGDELTIVAIDAAGNESPALMVSAGPDLSAVALTESSQEMTGVAGQELPETIEVQVVGPVNQPIPGLTIAFEVRTGGGTLSRTTVTTSVQGTASTAFTLGPDPGLNEVVARLEARPETEVVILANGVDSPRVDDVSPEEAQPGDTVTIDGANFSPVARHNEVAFGNEAATVVGATATRLTVQVPPFATQGPVSVTLTGVASNTVSFNVLPAPVEAPPVGDVELITLSQSDGQVVLGFEDAQTEYTLILESLNPGGGEFTATVTGDRGVSFSHASSGGGLASAAADRLVGESLIREMERRHLSGLPRVARSPARALEPAQEIGSRRDFFVVNEAGPISITDRSNFDEVTATLRFRGNNTLLYVDDRVASAISGSQIDAIGDRFDDQTFGTNVAAFGPPSDIDGNGRVIILLSPTVNSLTTPEIFEEGARIVGFFFGLDLLPNPAANPFANGGEVFYAVVPDENMSFGSARVTREEIVPLLTSVFAHEFEHMISFNQHILVRDGNPEDLWLDEGLAHMAEELNGLRLQNQLRSALFLDGPEEASLTGGGNALDERGAAYLFVQYMVDRFGEAVLRDLVQTNRTGINNVTIATDTAFQFLFHQWAAALLLDGPTIDPNDAEFEIPTLPLRELFAEAADLLDDVSGPFLGIETKALRGNALTVTQEGTSSAYIRVTTPGRVNAPITIDGATGSNLQVTIVRTR